LIYRPENGVFERSKRKTGKEEVGQREKLGRAEPAIETQRERNAKKPTGVSRRNTTSRTTSISRRSTKNSSRAPTKENNSGNFVKKHINI
jgi:hypothetical protein